MLVLSDLGIASLQTLPLLLDLLLERPERSVLIYPGLIVALQAYGDAIAKHIGTLSLQGGNDLFFELAV